MINLKHEVQKRGFTVAHIKTYSIKIPNATPGIIQFVMDYGKEYGYTFEHEATYDRMCLVNDAVYIAKYKDGKHAGEWTATGTQFQVPYIFKTLFSKEKIEFSDMCETKAVSIPIEDEYFIQWHKTISILSPLIQKAITKIRVDSMNQILNIIFVKLYMDYDLEQDFFPQFIANRDMMIKMLNDLPIHGGEQDG